MTVLRFNSQLHADAFSAHLVGREWLTFYAETQVCIVCEDGAINHDNTIIVGLIEQVSVPWASEKIAKALGDPENWDNFFARAICSEVVFSHIC